MDAAQPLQNTADTPTIDHKEVIMQQSALALAKVEFGNYRDPELVVKEAAHIANVFQHKMNTILDTSRQPILYRNFGPSRHITRPGWQLLASMFRVTAGIVPDSEKFLEFPGNITGWRCTAEAIYVPNGHRISTAVGMCLNDEENWDTRPVYEYNERTKKREKTDETVQVPLFQLLSMAQTRACSKVMSNLFAFVAIMAGCSGTAAEEMPTDGSGAAGAPAAAQQTPQRTQNGNGTINDAQVRRLFSLNKQAGRSREGLGVILAAHGYTAPSNADNPVEAAAYLVKKGDFDKIQDEVLKPA